MMSAREVVEIPADSEVPVEIPSEIPANIEEDSAAGAFSRLFNGASATSDDAAITGCMSVGGECMDYHVYDTIVEKFGHMSVAT